MKYFAPACLLMVCMAIACSSQRYNEPLPPEEALKSFQLIEGFDIEVYASEPHVLDPVSMIFDEKGDVYVVEMPDYPYKPEADKAKGRIRKLIDIDKDGKIDKSVIFADSLSEATSILTWEDGLLVTSAPHIFYLKDTNDDDRADDKEILFSGFFANNSEAQITNLRFSVDNWIYAANFGQPGEVSFSRKPDAAPLTMNGGDFRFRLDRGQFELAAGPTQFGQAIDDWGNRFMSQNTLHIRQAVIPWRYLHRHTYLASFNTLHNISDHDLEMFQQTPPPYWRAERTRRRQKRYDEQNLNRIEYAEDHFTGASGATFYGGHAFPEDFYGDIFIGDVAGNLIHRDELHKKENSPLFVAKRAKQELDKEFLSSTDPWFRPANFAIGPDGYLYVIDMYRQHIETPLSIPEDLKADMDFYNGSQHGRIYRIKPKDTASEAQVFADLSNKSSLEILEFLKHPNQWYRLQAQRLLLEEQDISIEQDVKSLFHHSEDPRTRLHALYVLEGLNLLKEDMIKSAMSDSHPAVRRHGIILSERIPELLPLLLEMVNDEDAQVVFQACLSLGEFTGDELVYAFVQVLMEYGNDAWFRTAILSSEPGSSLKLFEALIAQNYFSTEEKNSQALFLKNWAYIIGARNRKGEVNQFLVYLADSTLSQDSDLQLAGFQGLNNGLEKENQHLNLDKTVKEWLQEMKSNSDTTFNDIIEKLLE